MQEKLGFLSEKQPGYIRSQGKVILEEVEERVPVEDGTAVQDDRQVGPHPPRYAVQPGQSELQDLGR